MADDVMAPPTPDASQLPAASGQNPMQQPAAQPPGPPSADQQHSWLGRGIRHIASALEGQEVSYQPDPNTGEAKEVVSPRKPGGLFRDILLGAIAGGAAGSPQKGQYSSGAAGLFKGAQAAMQAKQDRQGQQQQQIQGLAQKLKAQKDQKDADEKAQTAAQASIALNNLSQVQYARNLDTHSPENVQRHNLSGDIISGQAMKIGGIKPVIQGPDGKDLNGVKGNGPAVMKMVTDDPTLMQGPEGYHRVPIFHFDTTDMEHEAGKGYKDADGKAIDPNEHASVSFIDVPNASWGKNITVTKGTINDLAGAKLAQGNDSDSVTTPFGSAFSLGLKNIQDMNKQQEALMTPPKDDNAVNAEAAKIAAIRDNPNASPKDKHWADIHEKMGAAFNKSKAGQLETQNAAKTEGKQGDLPPLTETSAPGFIAKAQSVLTDPKSTPEQKALAQKQMDYGTSVIKTIQTTAANMAGAKKREELAAERASIPKGAVGPASLPPDMQSRFSALPAPVQGQIKDMNADGLAALFAIADGDAELNAAANRVYKGSDQLSQMQVLGYVKQIAPQWSKQLYKAKQNLLDDYTSQKNGTPGQNISSFNTFLQHAADASDVVQNWRQTKPDTGVAAIWNKPMNWIRQNVTGDPGIVKLEAALDPVRSEYKSFLLNNRASHTEDIQTMDKILKDTATPAQIEAGLKQLAHTGVRRLGSLNNGWKRVTGGNYPDLVYPETIAAGAKLGLGDELSQYDTGGQINATSMRQNGQGGGQAPPPSALKEGTHTTFANGTTWTLQGGKPVQVQPTQGQQ